MALGYGACSTRKAVEVTFQIEHTLDRQISGDRVVGGIDSTFDRSLVPLGLAVVQGTPCH